MSGSGLPTHQARTEIHPALFILRHGLPKLPRLACWRSPRDGEYLVYGLRACSSLSPRQCLCTLQMQVAPIQGMERKPIQGWPGWEEKVRQCPGRVERSSCGSQKAREQPLRAEPILPELLRARAASRAGTRAGTRAQAGIAGFSQDPPRLRCSLVPT